MQGQIIKQISNDYSVLVDDKVYICKPRGKFRNMNITPLVGDEVIIDENKVITDVLPRKNELVRPSVANIDQVVILTSVKDPDFDTNLLDKLLTIIEYNSIHPVICITKMDLIEDSNKDTIYEYIDYYKKIGYEVYLNSDLDSIKNIFKDKLTVFTGQSGAGKSTLLNNLDSTLNIKTAEISKALGRGKHTTRHVELLDVYGGLVADTPGFSAVAFTGMSEADIRDNFIEFNEYRELCKYRSCMHVNEDTCEIKKQVELGNINESRYKNYLKFINKG